MGAINQAAQAAAERYCAEGWRVVPIPLQSKRPIDENWPDNHYAPGDVTGNVGVILGPASRGLVDFDCDSYWALQLAPHYMPATCTFGRASKRRSHWLYYCDGIRTRKFTFTACSEAIKQNGKAVELVELRGQNASNNRCAQTVFPGSVHESGEPIEWDSDAPDDIATIERGELVWRVTRLTVAAIIADGWQEGTQRNNKARAWAGGLLQAQWTAEEVRELFEAVFEVAQVEDEQREKDLGAVERTIASFESGTRITGFGSLVSEGLIDPAVVRRVEHHCRTPDTLARELKMAGTVPGRDIAERLLREAQETDKLGAVADEIANAIVARDATESSADPSQTVLGRIIDLSTPPEPLDYVCEGLALAPGKISAIGGFSGVSKGLVLNLLALCIASGKPFLGKRVERRRVAMLDFETGPLLETRIKRLARGLGIDLKALQEEDWLVALHARAPMTEEYLQALETAVDRNMVLCVDSYTSAVLGDQNESIFADPAFRLGDLSVAKNATIVAVMHERKTTAGKREDGLQMIAGTGRLSAALQTAISLTRPDAKDKALIEMRCARAPEEEFEALKLRWVDVKDPNGKDTIGGRIKAEKWGLRAELQVAAVAAAHSTASADQEFKRAAAEAETLVLSRMRLEYPGGLKATVSEFTRAGSSAARPMLRVAIRELVKRGALNADFHWTTEARARQQIWLSGGTSEIGVKQS